MLIILSGLPGVGKTTIARELARTLAAIHIRIDSIEQAMREAQVSPAPLDDAGYRIGYAIAADNLRLGRIVIADSVNPIPQTRNAWRDVAVSLGARVVEVEIQCDDPREHQARVEHRMDDIPGLLLPSWQAVLARDYRRWDRDHVVINTAGRTADESVAALLEVLATRK